MSLGGFVDLEDFEFRPITEGLGFHKKVKNESSERSEVSRELPSLDTEVDADIKARMESRRATLEKKVAEIPFDFKSGSEGLFSKPLPRTAQDVPQVQAAEAAIEVPRFHYPKLTKPNAKKDVIQKEVDLNTILDQVQIEDEETQEQLKTKLELTGPSLLSLFLDFTMVTGLSLLFILALVGVTKIDVVSLVGQIHQDHGIQIGVILLVYAVSQLYLMISRGFFGQTLGEWSLDTQLGSQEDQNKISYPFKLILRSIILTVTGVVLLPLLSLLFGKDLTGKVSGLSLYRQR